MWHQGRKRARDALCWVQLAAVLTVVKAQAEPAEGAALNEQQRQWLQLRSVPQIPFEYSQTFDLYNQGEVVRYFEEKFYAGTRSELNDQELQQVEELRRRAAQEPVLALAAAQALYMFAWFRPTGQIIRSNVVAAAELFEQSIAIGGCGAEVDDTAWSEGSCDIRWTHAMLLYNWLSEMEAEDVVRGQAYRAKAFQLLEGLRQMSRYAKVAAAWVHPLLVSFNALLFPGALSRPIWDTDLLPMGRFLEESHPIFKAELEAILNDPRDLYAQLMGLDRSREHLATPGGWDTLRIVRYHHWFEIFCEAAPRTCALIRSRPEINKCDFMNVNYVRLNPGANLKPHYGNGPRLSAHLSVIAPEPLRSGMSVGTQRTLWVEGRAVIFDDTFPHCVSNWGTQPRYVMLVWFCHPCDGRTEHGQTCPPAAKA